MAEAFAADLRLCYLDAAFVANNAAVLYSLVLAAETFPIRDGPEDACTKETVAFGLERPVIYRLRFRHLAVRPGTDLLGRSKAYTDRFVISRE